MQVETLVDIEQENQTMTDEKGKQFVDATSLASFKVFCNRWYLWWHHMKANQQLFQKQVLCEESCDYYLFNAS